ncbi:MAG: DUF7793 family protein, partial [Bacteroidia bacterium]
SSIIWFEDGILFSNPKPGVPPVLTMEEINEEMKVFRSITNNKKMCMVLESSPKSPPPPKDQRDFIAEQITSITKAMALVTTSPVSKMIANLFFGLKPPPYPMKMFTNKEDAVEWIKQYI